MTTATSADAPAARTAYLVLGMHRSGTSAATQLLALAGAELPRNVMPGDEHNAKGYFEPWKIAVFNDQRLRAAGSAWDDVFAYPAASLSAREERAWAGRALQLFETEYAGAAWPLLKDPRITVLMPAWRKVFDEAGVGLRCVVPVRHPLAVAGSLERRNGFPVEKSILLWTAYMLAAEAYTRDLPRAFVAYDALLADWRGQAARIERAHGTPLPALDEAAGLRIDAFLSPELRHNAGDGDLAARGHAGALARAALDWFEAAARDAPPPAEGLAAVAAELAQLKAQMGALVSPAARDLDAARAELLELRQRRAFLEDEIGRLSDHAARLQIEYDAVSTLVDAALADG